MQRFEAIDLAAHGVELIALSKDTVADAARHRRRDGLRMRLLADPGLEVIRRYGLEHHKAVEFSGVGMKLLGVHLSLVPKIKTMAIPTSLLIDEEGVVRWIDQADDYRIRSDDERVLKAVQEAFG